MSGRIMADGAEPREPPPPPPEPPREPVEPPPPPPPPEPQPAAEAAQEAPEGQETARDGEGVRQDLPPDVQKRIDRATWEKHEARRQLEEAQARLAQIEHERQQAARGGEPDPVETAKAQLRQEWEQREFNQRCNEVARKGQQEYGAEFDEAIRALTMVGYNANRPDALAAIAAMPEGHHVYRMLAADLDNAHRVLNLPPMAMAMELARIGLKAVDSPSDGLNRTLERGNMPLASLSQPGVPVTKAPEPLRPVGGTSRTGPIPLEKTSMADFIRRRDAEEKRSRIMR